MRSAILSTLLVLGLWAGHAPLAVPAFANDSASQDVDEALDLLNDARREAGLRPVRLDPGLTAACEKHANYLLLNYGKPAIQGLLAHREQPGLPGYTDAGAMAGKASDIHWVPLTRAVPGWLNTLYHRNPMMNPGLKTVGLGAMRDARGHYVSLLMFGQMDLDMAEGYPVCYPPDRSSNTPFSFKGGEVPDPAPGGAAKAGPPITLHFHPWVQVTGVSATLEDDRGADVPFYLSSPERPATQYQQGGAVCLIPKRPLRIGGHYWVSVTASVSGNRPQTWRWSFTTAEPPQVNTADSWAMNASLNTLNYYVGEVRKARLIGGQAFFEFKTAPGQKVTFFLDRNAWAKVKATGYADPAQFTGKRVRVLATGIEIVPGEVGLLWDDFSELTLFPGR